MGFAFYFDVKAKKRKGMFFQYPMPQSGTLSMADMQNRSSNPGQERGLNAQLKQLPMLAVWGKNDVKEMVFIQLPESEIKATNEAINETEMLYSLTVPLAKIFNGAVPDIINMSIG